MKKMHRSHSRWAALAALMLTAACDGGPHEPRVMVEEAWVRLPAASSLPSAAYFSLKGNMEGTRLTGVSSPLVRRIELHESITEGGVSRMKKREDIEFPSRGALEFEPGGRHAMLIGLNSSVKAGGTLPLTFAFNNAPPVTVDAEVRSAGSERHGGH